MSRVLSDPPAAARRNAATEAPSGPATQPEAQPTVQTAVPSAAATPTLAYDQSPNHVTKRQFNFLLLLVFLHLILFAAFVCLPTVSPAVKKAWGDYQARQQQKKDAAAAQVKLQAVLNYSQPPTTLLYAEAPEDTRKLLTSMARTQTLSSAPFQVDERGNRYIEADFINEVRAARWEPPAMVMGADALTAWLATLPNNRTGLVPVNHPTIFLHGMKTPGGKERIVCVSMEVNQVTQHVPRGKTVKRVDIETNRSFRATVINHLDPATRTVTTTLQITDPPEGRPVLWVAPLPEKPPQAASGSASASRIPSVEVQPGRMWRVFAGQIDPNDPSRFSIPIEIDGKPMRIDGQLNDGDRVMLMPSSGAMVGWTSASAYSWDLALGPMTRPTTRSLTPGTSGSAGASKGR